MMMLYQVVQILYWLFLSVWVGGMVFLAIAAPIVFQVVRRLRARSMEYDNPALTGEQTTIVAGGIVGALLARLAQVQMICATALLPVMLVQLFLINIDGSNLAAAGIRLVLWIVAVLTLLYEWRTHYPRTMALRQKYLESVGEAEMATSTREAFDREHRKSEQLFLLTLCMVLGMLLLSANITPRPASTFTPAAATK